MAQMTPAQADRQQARDRSSGRYTRHYVCERCGRNAGYQYYSVSECNDPDFHGYGLILCKKCITFIEKQRTNLKESFRVWLLVEVKSWR